MWTVVYMAKNKKAAEKISETLIREGVLAKTQPVNKNTEEDDEYYEILVPEGEAEEALNILYEFGY